MIQLVLFDIDGTLIQSGGAGEKAFAKVCESEFGIQNGAERLRFAGRTDPSIVRDFFQQHGIEASSENFRRFFDRYVFYLDYLLGKLVGRVLPGVEDWLRELGTFRPSPMLGLLTGNIRLGAQLKLTHYGLWQTFRMGGFGDDHEDRNQIAAIARARGNELLNRRLEGREILVIGDTPRDIECAKAIDAVSLGVATGNYTASELQAHHPTWTAATLSDLSPRQACA